MLTHTRSSRHDSKTFGNRRPAWIVVSAMLYALLVSHLDAFAGVAILTWDPNTEPDLAGYNVHYGTVSGTYSVVANAGNTATYTVTGLGVGTYYFAVTAYDTSGNESGVSNEVSKSVVDTTPPVISAITAGAITNAGATITWTTDEGSTSLVEYGTTTAYGSILAETTGFVTAHSRVLTALSSATTYHYRVRNRDAAGNLGTSGDLTFTTTAAPDTTAPILSGITASGITSGSAIITWSTNEPATSVVDYGLSTTYGSSSALNTTPVTSHSRTLSNLTPSTTYYYRVRSVDGAGNVATSSGFTFATPAAPDTTAPTISAVSVSGITNTGATVTWTTNEVSTSLVEYGATTAYGASSALDPTLVTSHTRAITGLSPSTAYHVRVRSVDAAGNGAVSADNTFTTSAAPDTIAPLISNVAVGSITGSSATVTWTTNEGATSLVEYGATTTYGSALPETASFLTAHSRVFTGLSVSTTYHYRVRNRDAAGNLGASGNFTFTTTAAPDTTAPVVSGITASGITTTSAIITWNTNEPATSVVDYGLSTAYGWSSAVNTTPVTSHSRNLSTITPSTTYHYRVRSVDGSGNVATSLDRTFTTLAAPDTTAPTISAVTVAAITFSSAEITWTTNEAGTSVVQYSTDLSFTLSSPLNTTPVTNHRRLLTGLTSATVYNYRVITTDTAGNTAQSGSRTFTTTAASDTNPPQDVRDFSATGKVRQVTLAWVNPPDADFIGVRIRYRTDRFPADTGDGSLLGDFTGQPGQAMDTVHGNLIHGVTYFYAASTYDNAGNRQNTAFASATPSMSDSAVVDPQAPAGGCGMIVPRDGDPPGPGQAADLLVMVVVALLMMRRKWWVPADWFRVGKRIVSVIQDRAVLGRQHLQECGGVFSGRKWLAA